MGRCWQQQKIITWRSKHLARHDLQDFIERISVANEDATRGGFPLIFSKNDAHQINFIGSLGATDCSYCHRPNITRQALFRNNEDVTSDRIYSEYIKGHAYKVLVITSHGINEIDNNNTNKFILHIQYGSGSTSDTGLQSLAMRRLLKKILLITGAGLLGDFTFQNSLLVIPPYNDTQLQSENAINLGKFNHSHSSDRMC